MKYNKKNIATIILVALILTTIGFTSINSYAIGVSSRVSSYSSSRSFSSSRSTERSFSSSYSKSTNTRFSTTNKYSSPKTSSSAKLNLSKSSSSSTTTKKGFFGIFSRKNKTTNNVNISKNKTVVNNINHNSPTIIHNHHYINYGGGWFPHFVIFNNGYSSSGVVNYSMANKVGNIILTTILYISIIGLIILIIYKIKNI